MIMFESGRVLPDWSAELWKGGPRTVDVDGSWLILRMDAEKVPELIALLKKGWMPLPGDVGWPKREKS